MSMEDEKWRENFAEGEKNRNRDGYKPYNREGNKNFNYNGNREGRTYRPRVQRAERAYSSDNAHGERYNRSYNRENVNSFGEQ